VLVRRLARYGDSAIKDGSWSGLPVDAELMTLGANTRTCAVTRSAAPSSGRGGRAGGHTPPRRRDCSARRGTPAGPASCSSLIGLSRRRRSRRTGDLFAGNGNFGGGSDDASCLASIVA
jgi:hypothetical protein